MNVLQAINSDGKLTTILSLDGAQGLVEYHEKYVKWPNPWFNLNYTGQRRYRDRLCDASVIRNEICVGSQALIEDDGQASESDEGSHVLNQIFH